MKIRTENGFNCNEDDVLNQWKNDFCSLYNIPETNDFNDEFMNYIKGQKEQIETNVTETNDFVNRPISYDEVEKIVNKLK